jgi:hypothetical protein
MRVLPPPGEANGDTSWALHVTALSSIRHCPWPLLPILVFSILFEDGNKRWQHMDCREGGGGLAYSRSFTGFALRRQGTRLIGVSSSAVG